MSNDRIGGRIDGVQAAVKTVELDVLSPKRRPAAATARVRLVFRTSGERAQRVAIRGRLLLTRVKGRWRVFGFDMTRAVRPLATSGEGES